MISQRNWGALVLAALLWVPTSSSAQSTGVLSRQQLQGILDSQKRLMRDLVHSRNPTRPLAPGREPDKLGHTMRSDLQANVMVGDTENRLQDLLASATADLRAGDLPGAQVKAGYLQSQLKSEAERQQAIMAYWQEPLSPRKGDFNSGDVSAMLQANGMEWPRENQLDDLLATFSQQIASRDFVTAMNTTFPRLKELLNARHHEQAQLILSGLDDGRLRDVRSGAPTGPCVPAKSTSGSDEATIDVRTFPRTDRYYPSELKRRGVGGVISAFVIVSAEGCAERALIPRRSQNPELDAATLRIAIDGRYLPAEKDGNRVRDSVTFQVTFAGY